MATAPSAGEELEFRGRGIEVEDAATADPCVRGIALFFLQAGAPMSRIQAPLLASAGAVVVESDFLGVAQGSRGRFRRWSVRDREA